MQVFYAFMLNRFIHSHVYRKNMAVSHKRNLTGRSCTRAEIFCHKSRHMRISLGHTFFNNAVIRAENKESPLFNAWFFSPLYGRKLTDRIFQKSQSMQRFCNAVPAFLRYFFISFISRKNLYNDFS